MKPESPLHLFTGREHRLKPRMLRELAMRRLVPSVLTLLAICLGFASMRLAGEGRFEIAVFCIIAALCLDFLDGRVARFLHGSSRFGAELDSLADFLNFGCAPAWLAYQWALHDMGLLGWTIALCHVLCCALRLARFNAELDVEASRPAWRQRYFSGIPAPAGAGVLLLPAYLHFLGVLPEFYTLAIVAGTCLATSGLMISRWPTYSLKLIRPPMDSDLVPPLALMFVLVTVLTAAFPWISFTLITLFYLATLPVSGLTFYLAQQREKAQAEANANAPASEAEDRHQA